MVCIGGPFGLLMGMFLTMLMGSLIGIAFGLVVGLSFWLFVEGFVGLRGLDYRGSNPCHPGERVFEQGGARHLRGKTSVTGWLFLTNRRLLFRSLRFDRDGQEWSVPLEEIVEIQPFQILRIMPTGLRVVTTRGEERFAVADSAAWVGMISRVKIALATAIWDSVEAGPHGMLDADGYDGRRDDRIAERPGRPADAVDWGHIKTEHLPPA
jgi:hypothetical protein